MENGLEVQSPRLRAIAYYRHSLASQWEESIAIQRDQVHQWACEHDVEIIREFHDAGCSMGDSDERPTFTEMMQAWISVRTDFEYVLCLDASRWGRFPESELSARPIGVFLKYGKRVIFTSNGNQEEKWGQTFWLEVACTEVWVAIGKRYWTKEKIIAELKRPRKDGPVTKSSICLAGIDLDGQVCQPRF